MPMQIFKSGEQRVEAKPFGSLWITFIPRNPKEGTGSSTLREALVAVIAG